MFANNREAYRQFYFKVWQAYQQKAVLQPIEAQLIKVILMHPEYHDLLEKEAAYQDQNFSLEENPFFHMSLHLALHEQIQTNRPPGITDIYHALLKQEGAIAHECEHRMMACLAKMMWKAQETGNAPSDTAYLSELLRL